MTERADGRPRVERPRCPYCHDAIAPDDAKEGCRDCMAWHHAPCWREHAGCAACGREAAPGEPSGDAALVLSAAHQTLPLGILAGGAAVVAVLNLAAFRLGPAHAIAAVAFALAAIYLLTHLVHYARHPVARLERDHVRLRPRPFVDYEVPYERLGGVRLLGEPPRVLELTPTSGPSFEVTLLALRPDDRTALARALERRCRGGKET